MKLCIVCHERPPEVPDRNSTSRRKAVCRKCHGERLLGDLRSIVADRARSVQDRER